MSPKASKRLDLAVQYACRREGLPLRADFVRWARAALTDGGQIAIRLVDGDEGQRLNNEYRGKDHATNVLSFPYETEPLLMGDLVICPTVVAREAAEQGKPLAAHYAHLTVHGLLHLQGWDHENEGDAQAMEDEERKILAALGYPDPYAAWTPWTVTANLA
jgi:probable rRNA maturation factor